MRCILKYLFAITSLAPSYFSSSQYRDYFSPPTQAQELAWPITTARKLRESADVVYVKCDETRQSLQGFLRLGWKHLFLCSVGTRLPKNNSRVISRLQLLKNVGDFASEEGDTSTLSRNTQRKLSNAR